MNDTVVAIDSRPKTAQKIARMLNDRSSQPAAEARSHPATKSGRGKAGEALALSAHIHYITESI
jgi:hypothetical protein